VRFDDDYVDYLIRSVNWWHERDATTSDMLLKVMEEAGEAAEAYQILKGFKLSSQAPKRELDVARELADLIHAALVCVVHLGFEPDHVLEWQQDKTEEKYLNAPA
jgi:phosphoribosyl-ATP pyrophosphohydrolase